MENKMRNLYQKLSNYNNHIITKTFDWLEKELKIELTEHYKTMYQSDHNKSYE